MQRIDDGPRAQGFVRVVGIDEAGRGPLAGPVVAASCYMPPERLIPYINDSKKLTPNRREKLFLQLTQDPSIAYGVGTVSSEIIDEINILQATIRAMKQSVTLLVPPPDYLLVDGLELPTSIPNQKVIRGDARSLLIAAASIIAKVTRDHLMRKYHEQWPHYGFDRHKGYGTPQHLSALNQHGPSPIHRLTFAPCKIYAPKKRGNRL